MINIVTRRDVPISDVYGDCQDEHQRDTRAGTGINVVVEVVGVKVVEVVVGEGEGEALRARGRRVSCGMHSDVMP